MDPCRTLKNNSGMAIKVITIQVAGATFHSFKSLRTFGDIKKICSLKISECLVTLPVSVSKTRN